MVPIFSLVLVSLLNSTATQLPSHCNSMQAYLQVTACKRASHTVSQDQLVSTKIETCMCVYQRGHNDNPQLDLDGVQTALTQFKKLYMVEHMQP